MSVDAVTFVIFRSYRVHVNILQDLKPAVRPSELKLPQPISPTSDAIERALTIGLRTFTDRIQAVIAAVKAKNEASSESRVA